MTFAEISVGEVVFIDANVLVYGFAPDPVLGVTCSHLLSRIELGEVVGVTSSAVVSDVAHRLMTLEACQVLGWSYTGIAGRLGRHPEEVVKLVRYRECIDSLVSIGVQVLDVTHRDVLAAAKVSQSTGLLSNDSLIVALMQQYSITSLASRDADFDRVPSIVRFTPG